LATKLEQAGIRITRGITRIPYDIKHLRRVLHKLTFDDYTEHKLLSLVVFKHLQEQTS
jgi:hypothetical protein